MATDRSERYKSSALVLEWIVNDPEVVSKAKAYRTSIRTDLNVNYYNDWSKSEFMVTLRTFIKKVEPDSSKQMQLLHLLDYACHEKKLDEIIRAYTMETEFYKKINRELAEYSKLDSMGIKTGLDNTGQVVQAATAAVSLPVHIALDKSVPITIGAVAGAMVVGTVVSPLIPILIATFSPLIVLAGGAIYIAKHAGNAVNSGKRTASALALDRPRISSNVPVSCYLAGLIYHDQYILSRYKFMHGQVYRGIVATKSDLDKYEIGKAILTKSFWSTSTKLEKAIEFVTMYNKPKPHQLTVLYSIQIINGDTALNIRNLSAIPDEDEVLLLPYTAMEVTKIKHIGVNEVHIELVEKA